MKKIVVPLTCMILGALIGYGIHAPADTNARPTYGANGLPKNCRALIQANLDGIRNRQFSSTEALVSIERNCGALGSNWGY